MSICPFVCPSSKPLKQQKINHTTIPPSLSFIIHLSSFIIHPSSTFATFKTFMLEYYQIINGLTPISPSGCSKKIHFEKCSASTIDFNAEASFLGLMAYHFENFLPVLFRYHLHHIHHPTCTQYLFSHLNGWHQHPSLLHNCNQGIFLMIP